MAYLGELHPELFLVSPRPGGLANIAPSKPETEQPAVPEKDSKVTKKKKTLDKSFVLGKASMKSSGQSALGGMSRRSSMKSTTGSNFEAAFLTSTPENNSREYRINKVLHTSQWMPPDYDDDQSIPMPSSDPLNNVMMMLSIVISTIMLMPAAVDYIPKDHLRWTLSYLECIKDEFGNYPPNIRGIMNQIKLIDNTIESFNETERDAAVLIDDAAQGVIPATVPDPAATAAPVPPEPAAPAPPEPAAPNPPEPAAPNPPEPADPDPVVITVPDLPEPADPNPDDPPDEA